MLYSINAILRPSYSFLIRPRPQRLIMMYCRFFPIHLAVMQSEKGRWACHPFWSIPLMVEKQGCLSLSHCQSPAESFLWACHHHAWPCCCSNESGNFKGTHDCHLPCSLPHFAFLFSSSSISLLLLLTLALCLSIVFFSPVPSSLWNLLLVSEVCHRSFLVTRFYKGCGYYSLNPS